MAYKLYNMYSWIAYLLNFILCESNNVPLIGILTIPAHQGEWVPYAPGFIQNYTTSVIISDYTEWILSGGGDWIPILFDDDWDNIIKLIPQLNGILFQGGAGEYNPNTLYYQRFDKILSFIRQYGIDNYPSVIPTWSTCLSFEALLAAISINYKTTLSDFNAMRMMSNITYTQYVRDQKSIIFDNEFVNNVYKDLIIEYSTNYEILYQDHSYGVTPDAFDKDPYLTGNFTNLGISYDKDGIAFVSLIESKDMIINGNTIQLAWYASQYHPEKAAYQFTNWLWPSDKTHTVKSIIVNQYFAQFFVNQCRILNNNILSIQEIVEYNKEFIGRSENAPYEMVYWFPQ